MKSIPLAAHKRSASGKGGARQLRAAGRVPAILYGEHTAPVTLALSAHDFAVVLHKASSEHILIDLNVQGSDGSELALVKEVQHDPISGDVLHVDFLHILPTKKIRVTVPVHLTGIASGVKNFGGILQLAMRYIELEAIPANLPELVEVDVSHLNIGDAVHVRELTVERVTIVSHPDRTVASVVPPTVLKEAAPAEAAPAEAAAGAPEVITEKKEEEGEEVEGKEAKKEAKKEVKKEAKKEVKKEEKKK